MTDELITFWAMLIIANVWLAAGEAFFAAPFLIMCVILRLPRWVALFRRVEV